MREFKFIRGIYKDEKILNQEETKDTLFALYKDGNPVSLDVKNDVDFQEKITGLDSDDREIFTIRPSQFKVTATKQNTGNYELTYDLDGNVYDNSMRFPDKVKEEAESHLNSHTEAHIPKLPSLNFEGESKDPTTVDFTFNNDERFTKTLYFRVSGNVEEYARSLANSEETITAYKVNDNNDVIYNESTDGIFHNGKLQQKEESVEKHIAYATLTVNEANYTELEVASIYTAETSFMFVHNGGLTSYVNYAKDLEFDLYKKVDRYLTQANAEDAFINEVFNSEKFVAFYENNGPSSNVCYNKDDEVYIYSVDDCVKNVNYADRDSYTFYEIHIELAYIFVGNCKITTGFDDIVIDYESSYSEFYIIDGTSLRHLKGTDLSANKYIEVYTSNYDNKYHIIKNSVYLDDTKNAATYNMLSYTGEDQIKDANATTTNGGKVVAKQSETTYRKIVESTLKIIATESLD